MEWFILNLPLFIVSVGAGYAISAAHWAKKEAQRQLDLFKKWEFESVKKDVGDYEREKWTYIKREELSGHIGGLLLKIADLREEVRVLETIVDERTGAKE